MLHYLGNNGAPALLLCFSLGFSFFYRRTAWRGSLQKRVTGCFGRKSINKINGFITSKHFWTQGERKRETMRGT